MDRDDADQEGITLAPSNTVRLVAEAAARQVIIEHIRLCPFNGAKVEERLRTQENRFMLLIGFMFGSGLLGGAAGAAVFKALGG
jgi:hypothetical protein